MTIQKCFSYCLALAFVFSISSDSLNAQEGKADTLKKQSVNWQPLFKGDKTSIESARGIWEAGGYGYLFEITESSARHFSTCEAGTWEHDTGEYPELYFVLGESNQKARITIDPTEPGYHLTRIERLPANLREGKWTQTQIFDVFVSTMSELYPFFKERKFDWKNRVESHRPKVSDNMPDKELFEVLASLLKNLKDGHVDLSAEIGGEEFGAYLPYCTMQEIDQLGKKLCNAILINLPTCPCPCV